MARPIVEPNVVLRYALFFSVVAFPTAAEVCDKAVGEAWSPDQGPVNVLTLGKVLGLLAAVGLAAALVALLRWRWLAWIAATYTAFMACLPLVLEFVGDEKLTRAAIAEGCIAEVSTLTVAVTSVAFLLISALFVSMGRGRFAVRSRRHDGIKATP